MKKRSALVIIDPQNCFMNLPEAPLPVTGAVSDMMRLTHLLLFSGTLFERIFISLDTHPSDHISHAVRWVDAYGNHPAPFTIITHEAYLRGEWRAAHIADQEWQGEYLRLLTRPHCIWPVHGQKPSWEWQVYDSLAAELKGHNCTYIEKGVHRDTEQFGIFGADVPYPGALETEISPGLIAKIDDFDRIVFAGEASSHCVMDSVNQFLEHMPSKDFSKVVLLQDCMSPVHGFEQVAADWMSSLVQRGVIVTDSADFIS